MRSAGKPLPQVEVRVIDAEGNPLPPNEVGEIAVELVAESEKVTLTVQDSGPGMPEDFIPVALARFTRAEGPRSALAGGGLGLAIVAALAGSAGGSIVLANASEGGLLATVTLPADTTEGAR